MGETVKMLALSVWVYTATGSSFLAAITYVAAFLPLAVGGTFLLALADRRRPRAVLVGYDLIRLAGAVLLASGWLPTFGMLASVLAIGIVSPVSHAARSGLLADMLAGDRYVVARSLFTALSGSTQVVGFAIGGLMLAFTEPLTVLWLTAASCAICVLLARFGLTDRPPRSTGGGTAIGHTWRSNRTLLRNPRTRGLLLAQCVPLAIALGAEGAIVPYSDGLDETGAAGTLFTASALGMMVGHVIVGRLVAPRRRESASGWLAVLLGLPLPLFYLEPNLPVATLLIALATTGTAYQLGLAGRYLVATPLDIRGQALGLVTTGTMAVQGFAVAAVGGLADLLAPGTVIALTGVVSLLSTAMLWTSLRI